ncbi:molybdopterin-dependent oxidoreductase [Desulfatiferula olefinivorans]
MALGMGVTAGLTFTPLPWKLTDDLSIWTQNWPWTPVPEDGEAFYDYSVCTLCPGGCGISVRKINDRVVKIEGLPDHPVNQGGLCPLGLSGAQLLYGPDRITEPLKRTGKRGEGAWQPLSWDEALAEVVGRLKKLDDEGRPEALACICDTDRGTVPRLFKRLLARFGSPNFMAGPSMHDGFEAVLQVMHGLTGPADMGFDVENADFIMSFGSGIIEGWGSPVRMIRAHSRRREDKATWVHVDQRLSNTAAAADERVAVRPGTESDLALGMIAVILEEKRYDSRFDGDQSSGFAAFRTMVLAEYGPARAAEKTGIDKARIIDLARRFTEPGSASLALCGRGKGLSAGSTREFLAVHSLNVLAGRINAPGGVLIVPSADDIAWAGEDEDQAALAGKERLDGAGTSAYPGSRYLVDRFFDVLADAASSPVEVLLVSEANPCYTLSDSNRVREAMARIPFVVSFSSRMDDTAVMADLILPNHFYLERYQDVPVRAGLSRPTLGLCRPVIEPRYDTRHTGDVILSIAADLGPRVAEAFPWDSYRDCLEQGLGSRWADLDAAGFLADEAWTPDAWTGTVTFPEPFPEAVGLSGDPGRYPLILTPKESLRLSAGNAGDAPFTMKTVPDTDLSGTLPVVEISPRTGAEQGLRDGRTAVLETPRGRMTVLVRFFPGIMPGLIAMPRGLGHQGFSPYVKDKGGSYNALVGVVEDPLSGRDAAWGIRARLSRA